MNIKRHFSDFSDGILSGRHSFILELDKNGFHIDNKNLVEMVCNFTNIVIKGDEKLEQRNDIDYLIKNVKKKNSRCSFMIYIDGTKQPFSLGKYDDTFIMVNLKLKKSKINYTDRIIPGALDQYNQLNSFFIFNITNDEEYDEVVSIVTDIGLYKSKIYLETNADADDAFFRKTAICGYNYVLSIRKNKINDECDIND